MGNTPQAATNRDLEREVEEGRFRSDLYYRLAGIALQVPALRERPADIPLLATHFLRTYASRWGRAPLKLSDQALESLMTYPFPGNVRELENEMGRLVALFSEESVLQPDALNERISNWSRKTSQTGKQPMHSIQPMSLAEMERHLILVVLEHTAGNRTRAAEILGISCEGLRTMLKRLGLGETG